MNTEEVVAMIDAITEGKPFVHRWESETDSLIFATSPEKAVLSDTGDFCFDLRDPRTAREIAGALVAWANRKDGIQQPKSFEATDPNNPHPGMYHFAFGCRECFPALKTMTEESLASQLIDMKKNGRAQWYRRNVDRMSQETKDRNLQDLRGIQAELHPNDVTNIDVEAAMQILRDNGAKDE